MESNEYIIWAGEDTQRRWHMHYSADSWKELFHILEDKNIVHGDAIYDYLDENDRVEHTDDEEHDNEQYSYAIADMDDEDWRDCVLSSGGNAFYQDYLVVDAHKEYIACGKCLRGYELEDVITCIDNFKRVAEPQVLMDNLRKYIEPDIIEIIDKLVEDEYENKADWLARAVDYLISKKGIDEEEVNSMLAENLPDTSNITFDEFYNNKDWNEGLDEEVKECGIEM